MRLSYLVRGFPGHPLHPPLTDATITGLADWLSITWRSLLSWTATWHMLSMLTATGFFALAAVFGHDRYVAGEMGGKTLIATLVGFVALTVGGWLGGAVVFTHGMRVLALVDEPPGRAAIPGGAEKEEAEA